MGQGEGRLELLNNMAVAGALFRYKTKGGIG